MPWIPQTDVTIQPGQRGQLGNLTTSNQTIVASFPNFAATDVRLFGVVVLRRSLDLVGGSLLSWRAPIRVWNNPELITMQGGLNGDQVWFYVPEKFGAGLSVRLYLFA